MTPAATRSARTRRRALGGRDTGARPPSTRPDGTHPGRSRQVRTARLGSQLAKGEWYKGHVVTVSRARAAEYEEVCSLLDAFLATIGEQGPGPDGYTRIREALECNEIEFFVARAGGMPVGLVSLTSGFTTYRAAPFAMMEDLFVAESWRGRGVARRLIETCAARAAERGCGSLLAATGDVAMWLHLGFRPIGRLMSRDL